MSAPSDVENFEPQHQILQLKAPALIVPLPEPPPCLIVPELVGRMILAGEIAPQHFGLMDLSPYQLTTCSTSIWKFERKERRYDA
ncbi:MAG: hypothetical protein KGL39_29560 [Patescibacteria group bacterium]|nr:hypothetical protein [Patescibacteria group bacterium]